MMIAKSTSGSGCRIVLGCCWRSSVASTMFSIVGFIRRRSASPFHFDLCHAGYDVTVGHYTRDTLIAVFVEAVEEPRAAVFRGFGRLSF